jgi:hypothetical protein
METGLRLSINRWWITASESFPGNSFPLVISAILRAVYKWADIFQRFKVQGSVFKVQGSEFRSLSLSKCRVPGSGLRLTIQGINQLTNQPINHSITPRPTERRSGGHYSNSPLLPLSSSLLLILSPSHVSVASFLSSRWLTSGLLVSSSYKTRLRKISHAR